MWRIILFCLCKVELFGVFRLIICFSFKVLFYEVNVRFIRLKWDRGFNLDLLWVIYFLNIVWLFL